MVNKLFVGFKGKNNSSSILIKALMKENYLLTNSFEGLRKDIDNLSLDYDEVYLFGVDKKLKDTFRLERFAEKDGVNRESEFDLDKMRERFFQYGIKTEISIFPSQYLCNEAYWHLLDKYHGNVVLIHIPTLKHFCDNWIISVRRFLC